MDQPVPKVTKADVSRIAKRDFGPTEEGGVVELLSEIPLHGFRHDPYRVQLAVLKLAEGNKDRLREAIMTASIDERDVIAFAEYPRYTKQISTDVSDVNIRPEVIREDWRQYATWLDGLASIKWTPSQAALISFS